MPTEMPAVCQQDRPIGADPSAREGRQDAATPAGYMRDHKDRLVPAGAVKPEHQLMDALVRDIHRRVDAAEAMLARLKAEAFGEIDAFAALLAEKYRAPLGGQKGNMTLSSYDGSLTIEVAIADTLRFGPELQAAKALIDQCLHRLTKDAGDSLKVLVLGAFEVDKQGSVRVDRVLELRRHQINEPEWTQAMEAIADAVHVVSSKRYVRFYRRPAPGAKAVQVPLDIARVAG